VARATQWAEISHISRRRGGRELDGRRGGGRSDPWSVRARYMIEFTCGVNVPQNGKTKGRPGADTLQSINDKSLVIESMRVEPCVSQTRFLRRTGRTRYSGLSFSGMSVVSSCCPDLHDRTATSEKKNHRRENGSEVGRKEVPSGDDKTTSWTESR
jgi:hypothetical protein